MKIRLLASSVRVPATLQSLTTFLVNDELAIDGGSLGVALDLKEQRRVRGIIVTHSHLDHIASLPVFVAEAFPFLKEPLRLYSTREIIRSLKKHVFNDAIWPDFTRIRLKAGGGVGLQFVEIQPMISALIGDLRITPVKVNHTVPTIGLIVEDDHSSAVFTSDTDSTEDIWCVANRTENLRAVFADVSYPDEMSDLASESKHLTPRLLALELSKLKKKVQVFAVHIKPQFRAEVLRQLKRLKRAKVKVARINYEYLF